MKVKRLKDEIRYIKIERDAIYERLREDIIDQAENYFGILDVTKVHFEFLWDPDTDEFICAICDDRQGFYGHDAFDLKALFQNRPITTHTLYSKNCYSSISIDDCNALKSKEH